MKGDFLRVSEDEESVTSEYSFIRDVVCDTCILCIDIDPHEDKEAEDRSEPLACAPQGRKLGQKIIHCSESRGNNTNRG